MRESLTKGKLCSALMSKYGHAGDAGELFGDVDCLGRLSADVCLVGVRPGGRIRRSGRGVAHGSTTDGCRLPPPEPQWVHRAHVASYVVEEERAAVVEPG